jgi:hypothetical protein
VPRLVRTLNVVTIHLSAFEGRLVTDELEGVWKETVKV